MVLERVRRTGRGGRTLQRDIARRTSALAAGDGVQPWLSSNTEMQVRAARPRTSSRALVRARAGEWRTAVSRTWNSLESTYVSLSISTTPSSSTNLSTAFAHVPTHSSTPSASSSSVCAGSSATGSLHELYRIDDLRRTRRRRRSDQIIVISLPVPDTGQARHDQAVLRRQ